MEEGVKIDKAKVQRKFTQVNFLIKITEKGRKKERHL